MPGLYIAIACILALVVAMELGRRLLYRFNKLSWLSGTWFWVLLAWAMAGVTSLVVGNVMQALVVTIFMAFVQVILMSLFSWVVLKLRFRGRSILRSRLLAGISGCAGCFTIWCVSCFFGEPRSLMQIAFRGQAPWVFVVREYSSDAGIDFSASMTVELPAETLHEGVRGMSKQEGADGSVTYSWRDLPGGMLGAVCTIETNKDHTLAKFTYMSD